MLYISHNLAELERICDSIMVMKDGRVIEHGSTEQILNKPKEQYTKALIEAAFGGNIA
jgi:ABC-type microcin C transport system duplicated ATPase subunit YejF